MPNQTLTTDPITKARAEALVNNTFQFGRIDDGRNRRTILAAAAGEAVNQAWLVAALDFVEARFAESERRSLFNTECPRAKWVLNQKWFGRLADKLPEMTKEVFVPERNTSLEDLRALKVALDIVEKANEDSKAERHKGFVQNTRKSLEVAIGRTEDFDLFLAVDVAAFTVIDAGLPEDPSSDELDAMKAALDAFFGFSNPRKAQRQRMGFTNGRQDHNRSRAGANS